MTWKRPDRWTHVAAQRDGGKYVISRIGASWFINYLPRGTAQAGGRVAVPWLPGERTLALAKASCEAHGGNHALV